MTTKRADLLAPGDTIAAWGPDLEVVSVKPPGPTSHFALVKLALGDGQTTVVEYPPGVLVEVVREGPGPLDETEDVADEGAPPTEAERIEAERASDAALANVLAEAEAEQAARDAEEAQARAAASAAQAQADADAAAASSD